MITNEERREVAARLREIDQTEWCCGGQALDELESATGCGYDQDWQDMDLKDRLADLIEPEPERTCQNEDGCFHLGDNGKTWLRTMPYIFPPIQKQTSVLDQIIKIQEEAGEVMAAIPEGRYRVAEEAVDTIHACETLIRQLGVDYDAVVIGVIEKNRARGYYCDDTGIRDDLPADIRNPRVV